MSSAHYDKIMAREAQRKSGGYYEPDIDELSIVRKGCDYYEHLLPRLNCASVARCLQTHLHFSAVPQQECCCSAVEMTRDMLYSHRSYAWSNYG